MRLTGAIPKQSNSTVQIRPPPWLNLRRKPDLDLLPLELDFLYARGIEQLARRSAQVRPSSLSILSESKRRWVISKRPALFLERDLASDTPKSRHRNAGPTSER